MSLMDAPPEVPEWEIGVGGPRLTRPSKYFTDAQQFLNQNESRGRLGVIVKNRYGKKMPMTALTYYRMGDLFERGELEVVDYIANYRVDKHMGLEGFDTEGMEAFSHMGL